MDKVVKQSLRTVQIYDKPLLLIPYNKKRLFASVWMDSSDYYGSPQFGMTPDETIRGAIYSYNNNTLYFYGPDPVYVFDSAPGPSATKLFVQECFGE